MAKISVTPTNQFVVWKGHVKVFTAITLSLLAASLIYVCFSKHGYHRSGHGGSLIRYYYWLSVAMKNPHSEEFCHKNTAFLSRENEFVLQNSSRFYIWHCVPNILLWSILCKTVGLPQVPENPSGPLVDNFIALLSGSLVWSCCRAWTVETV